MIQAENGGGSLKAAEPIFRAVLDSGGTFTLKPHGTSMLPTIVPGRDSVSLIKLTEPAHLYDILFYQRADGSFVLHRVAAIAKDGSYTLCGDHQTVLEKGVQPAAVVAVVSAIHLPQGDLLRGTRAFLAPARRRAWNRPLRRLYHALGQVYHRLFGRRK